MRTPADDVGPEHLFHQFEDFWRLHVLEELLVRWQCFVSTTPPQHQMLRTYVSILFHQVVEIAAYRPEDCPTNDDRE